jgi:hypothetical protein
MLVSASHPELLKGLDLWLQLGLISESQVRRLSQRYLTCPLSDFAPEREEDRRRSPLVRLASSDRPDFAPETLESAPESPNLDRQPSFVANLVQSFKDELSVRWLLFLGVFLTIVSSAVLAATQWDRFPAAGQYSILGAYTLIFAAVGWRIERHEQLQLTAKTLQAIALLLIPVNFWAMDTFQLWSRPLEWLVAAVAALSLTGIAWRFSRSTFSFSKPAFALFLVGSLLHWGWQIEIIPQVSLYSMAIATAILLRGLPRSQRRGKSFVLFALAAIFVRSFGVEFLDPTAMSLAVGIGAWVLAEEGLEQESPLIATTYQALGLILFVMAGLMAASVTIPWQAIAIGGLALHFFSDRVKRYSKRSDVGAIFAIGLIVLFLLPRLLPSEVRETVTTALINLTGYANISDLFVAIAVFAYSFAFLGLARFYERQEKLNLAYFAEFLALILALSCSGMALFDPVLRSLSFSLLAIAFAIVSRRDRPIQQVLIYLTHSLGLIAFCFSLEGLFPNLSLPLWAGILLGLMAIEWSIATLHRHNPQNTWIQSSWYLGFVLSGLSYLVLGVYLFESTNATSWGLLWLFTPLTLTATARFSASERRQKTAWCSSAALMVAQLLTLWQAETRLIGLAFAVGLTIVNVRYRKRVEMTVVHLGLAIGLAIALFWERLDEPGWLLFAAILLLLLWGFWQLFSSQLPLYATAAVGWGNAICVGEILYLTAVSFSPIGDSLYLLAAILTGLALVWRVVRSPHNLNIIGFAWTIELAVAQLIWLKGGNFLVLATASASLGLISLIITEIGLARSARLTQFPTVQLLPLAYAVLGSGLRLGFFTAYTGLITVGMAIVGIGVSHRNSHWRGLAYIALAFLSLGWYELVLYPMLQASEGNDIDAFTILAGVAVAIAIVYRLWAWLWQKWGRDRIMTLNLSDIIITAHLHWSLASANLLILMPLASLRNSGTFQNSPEPRLLPLSLAFYGILTIYALLQARGSDRGIWVYAGIAQGTLSWYFARTAWPQLAFLDDSIALLFAAIALLLYYLPWQRWGWRQSAWQKAALVLPLIALFGAFWDVSSLNLIAVALFYGWIAIARRQWRWSYLSLACLDWAIAIQFERYNLSDPLGTASLLGVSILYIAQVDPTLSKHARHYMRSLGMAIICIVALIYHQETGLIPAAIGLAAILGGLALQIRAFLYTGTVTFLLTAFYQLIILIDRYTTSKWIVGLVAGILLIAIAASFERRRDQMITAWQSWFSHLRDWQ